MKTAVEGHLSFVKKTIFPHNENHRQPLLTNAKWALTENRVTLPQSGWVPRGKGNGFVVACYLIFAGKIMKAAKSGWRGECRLIFRRRFSSSTIVIAGRQRRLHDAAGQASLGVATDFQLPYVTTEITRLISGIPQEKCVS